jgi:hypothetical protein
MCRWEVCGVGAVDPQLVGGAAISATAAGTRVIGTWQPDQVTGVV